MRVLFDIVHPAHVHFFKHVIAALEAGGHPTKIVARNKDVTTGLLDRLGFPYDVVGEAAQKRRVAQAAELLQRDLALLNVARRFRPDLILTRSPAGCQVGRLLGVPAVFDTDDGKAAGVHFWASAPFAHIITTPDCSREDYGRRHVMYPGYKQTAYLHPAHFTPDPKVRADLGVAEDEDLFVVRFVGMTASHDHGEAGFSLADKREVLRRLQARGRVFITHEGELPEDMVPLRYPLPPDRLHDVLAAADLLVCDSQTMAAEAAVLGTPSLRVSSWVGRLDYLVELEERYELTFAYRPEQGSELLEHLDRFLADDSLAATFAARRARMLEDKVDIATWMTRFVLDGAPLPSVKRRLR